MMPNKLVKLLSNTHLLMEEMLWRTVRHRLSLPTFRIHPDTKRKMRRSPHTPRDTFSPTLFLTDADPERELVSVTAEAVDFSNLIYQIVLINFQQLLYRH